MSKALVILPPECYMGDCKLCGKHDELRPYGPSGESVCFDCAMKDEETAAAQFTKQFESIDQVVDKLLEQDPPSFDQVDFGGDEESSLRQDLEQEVIPYLVQKMFNVPDVEKLIEAITWAMMMDEDLEKEYWRYVSTLTGEPHIFVEPPEEVWATFEGSIGNDFEDDTALWRTLSNMGQAIASSGGIQRKLDTVIWRQRAAYRREHEAELGEQADFSQVDFGDEYESERDELLRVHETEGARQYGPRWEYALVRWQEIAGEHPSISTKIPVLDRLADTKVVFTTYRLPDGSFTHETEPYSGPFEAVEEQADFDQVDFGGGPVALSIDAWEEYTEDSEESGPVLPGVSFQINPDEGTVTLTFATGEARAATIEELEMVGVPFDELERSLDSPEVPLTDEYILQWLRDHAAEVGSAKELGHYALNLFGLMLPGQELRFHAMAREVWEESIQEQVAEEMPYHFAPSQIHGSGLMVRMPIKAGTDLGVTHRLRSEDEWEMLPPGNYNHSSFPTAMVSQDEDGVRRMITLQDLDAGDELTVDYVQQSDLEQPQEGWTEHVEEGYIEVPEELVDQVTAWLEDHPFPGLKVASQEFTAHFQGTEIPFIVRIGPDVDRTYTQSGEPPVLYFRHSSPEAVHHELTHMLQLALTGPEAGEKLMRSRERFLQQRKSYPKDYAAAPMEFDAVLSQLAHFFQRDFSPEERTKEGLLKMLRQSPALSAGYGYLPPEDKRRVMKKLSSLIVPSVESMVDKVLGQPQEDWV